MPIISINFVCFFAVVFLGYYALPLKLRWIWLLVSSLFFYLFSNVANGIYLAITVISTFCGGLILQRLIKKEATEKNNKTIQKKKRLTIALVLLLNLGLLFIFKYFNFFTYNLTNLLGIKFSLNLPSLVLPLGISFYTFQSLGYLLDVYWETAKAQNNIAKLGLFVGFFPTVMQGPISCYNDLMPQLEQGHCFEYENAVYGIQRVAWGAFKKIVIADRLGVFVAAAYGNVAEQTGGALVVATILFAFQLYTDFSGYMDMMIGLSQMLGIKLKENFERPFFARSISEYWRKWHITLGTWFKDYLFYPLLKSDAIQGLTKTFSKKIKKKIAKRITTYIAMFILWTIIGLWHGASMSFVIGSGILHWFYIVVGETIGVWCRNKLQKMHVNTEHIVFQFLRKVRTFILVCIGFVFFRAATTADAFLIFKRIGGSIIHLRIFSETANFIENQDLFFVYVMLVSLLLLLVVSLLQERMSLREKISKSPVYVRYPLYVLLIVAIYLLGAWDVVVDAGQFIYFQF